MSEAVLPPGFPPLFEAGVITAIKPSTVPLGCLRVVVNGTVIEPTPEYGRDVVRNCELELGPVLVSLSAPVLESGLELGVITAIRPGTVPLGSRRVVVIGAVMEPALVYGKVVVKNCGFNVADGPDVGCPFWPGEVPACEDGKVEPVGF